MNRRKNQELLEISTTFLFFLIHEFGLISMEKFVNTKGAVVFAQVFLIK
jgi:hypothetical protein